MRLARDFAGFQASVCDGRIGCDFLTGVIGFTSIVCGLGSGPRDGGEQPIGSVTRLASRGMGRELGHEATLQNELLAQPEPVEKAAVGVAVGALQIIQQLAAARNQSQQPAAGMEILHVRLEMSVNSLMRAVSNAIWTSGEPCRPWLADSRLRCALSSRSSLPFAMSPKKQAILA